MTISTRRKQEEELSNPKPIEKINKPNSKPKKRKKPNKDLAKTKAKRKQ